MYLLQWPHRVNAFPIIRRASINGHWRGNALCTSHQRATRICLQMAGALRWSSCCAILPTEHQLFFAACANQMCSMLALMI